MKSFPGINGKVKIRKTNPTNLQNYLIKLPVFFYRLHYEMTLSYLPINNLTVLNFLVLQVLRSITGTTYNVIVSLK